MSVTQSVTLVLAGSLIYLNSLSNPFVLDDEGTILENQQIRSLASLAVLTPERELPVAGRPVVNVSFAINYALGGLDPTGYHLVNIAIHVVCALLLFALARALLERTRPPLSGRANDLAFAAALLWVVHPLNSEAVVYLTQRTESMMAMFYLLTLYASVRAWKVRLKPDPTNSNVGAGTNMNVGAGFSRPNWLAVAIGACALGMASKESMVTAPLMVVLIDRIFLFDSLGQALRARWRLYLGLAATWILLGALLWTGPRRLSAGFGSDVSAWTYLLNQAPMITRYLWLSFWPSSLVANYGWPVELTLTDVLPYVVFILALMGLTVVALRWRPQLGFLGAWFFITLAPSSSIVPIATEVGAERRMYLPLAALIVLAVLWGQSWRPRPIQTWPPGLTPFLIIAAALAATTFARNREYRSALEIAQVTVDRYPTPSGRHVLAESLLVAGRREEAMTHLHLAVPGAPRAHYTLGLELAKDGRWDEAIPNLEAFIEKQPRLIWVLEAHGILGTGYAVKENWPKAIEHFREVLKITPNNPVAHRSLADALMAAERFEEAIPHYRRYLATATNDTDALNQLGVALGATDRLSDAILTFHQALGIDPRSGALHRNLAFALWKNGDSAGAVQVARRAAALQPDDPGTKDLLQLLLGGRP